MAQFDFYAPARGRAAYIADLRANLLDSLATRIVAPLLELMTVNRRDLRRKIGSLLHARDALRRALDTLLVGF